MMEMEPADSDVEFMEIEEEELEGESAEDAGQFNALKAREEISDSLATSSQRSLVTSAFVYPQERLKLYPFSSNCVKIAFKPSIQSNIATASSTVSNDKQIVIINNQPIRLTNQSIINGKNKTKTLAAKPEGYPVTVKPKLTISDATASGRFILKSSNRQSTILTAPRTTGSVPTTYSTGSALASNFWKPSLSLLTSGYKFSSSTALASSSQTSTPTSPMIVPNSSTVAIPSRFRIPESPTTFNRQTQQIPFRAGGIQSQVMVPPNLYTMAQKSQVTVVRCPEKDIQYPAASLALKPHSAKPIYVQRMTPDMATNSSRMMSPMKRETDRQLSSSSSGGYRLLNTIHNETNFAIAKKNVLVNKFETFGSAQYVKKTQEKDKQFNETDLLHSIGSSKCVQMQSFVYADGHLYQNVSSDMATIAAKPVSLSLKPVVEARSKGVRRKPCNCMRSQCLKMYCECFANGELCQFDCKCKECFNNLENEDEREKMIKLCLERNPMAFKPKIGLIKDQTDALRRHKKGCNCRRSGCLKNYCECHEAKVACSENCKCTGCRNTEEPPCSRNETATNTSNSSIDSSSGTHAAVPSEVASRSGSTIMLDNSDMGLTLLEHHVDLDSSTFGAKMPGNFLTPDVIDATIQCVFAQANECQSNNLDKKESERLVLEEFGRCLVEIIEFSRKPAAD